MKKIKSCFVAVILVALLMTIGLASCTTQAPFTDSTHFPADASTYTILGRVSIEGVSQSNGYMKLLEAAKRKYPKCDDVVNIVVDVHANFFQKLFGKANYNLSGIAIDYKDF